MMEFYDSKVCSQFPKLNGVLFSPNPQLLNAGFQMLFGLMCVDQRCRQISVPKNSCHRPSVDSLHLHYATEGVSEVMDTSEAIKAGSFGCLISAFLRLSDSS